MAIRLETAFETVTSIKVVGIGGGGNNTIDRMVQSNLHGADFIAINTDVQQLERSLAPVKIQIGLGVSEGKGCGADPLKGRKAAEESKQQIKDLLKGTNMVFITAGMGGGTGTGGAPVIAEIARDMGILTIGVVTKPFKFEGARRAKQAEQGIAELKEKVDSLVIIPNERLKYVTDQKITFVNAFAYADDILKQAITSIYELITMTGLISLDFADVSTVMSNGGFAHMGVGHAAGKEKAPEAARMAIHSPLMETSINGAHGVLVNIVGPSEMELAEVDAAASLVQENAHPDATIIVGAAIDDTLKDEIRISIIATGFEGAGANPLKEGGEKGHIRPEADGRTDLDVTPFGAAAPGAGKSPPNKREEEAAAIDDEYERLLKLFSK